MSEQELLINIFIDTFTANLCFIFASEIAIWFAPKLRDVSYALLLVPAFFGVLSAFIVNYIIGFGMYHIFSRFKLVKEEEENYKIISRLYIHFWYIVALFSPMTLYCKVMTMVAGFLRFNPLKILILSAFARTLSYYFLA